MSVCLASEFFFYCQGIKQHIPEILVVQTWLRVTLMSRPTWDVTSIRFASHDTCHVDTSVKMTHIMMNMFLCKEHTDRLVAPCNRIWNPRNFCCWNPESSGLRNPKSTLIWNLDWWSNRVWNPESTCESILKPFAKKKTNTDNKRMKWSKKTINAICHAFAKCGAFYPLRLILRNWQVKH